MGDEIEDLLDLDEIEALPDLDEIENLFDLDENPSSSRPNKKPRLSSSSDVDKNTCKECKDQNMGSFFSFYPKYNPEKHADFHSGKTDSRRRKKNKLCEICGWCFYTKAELEGHLKQKHSQNSVGTCSNCKKTFLEFNKEKHDCKKYPKHNCPTCGWSHSRPYYLKCHQKCHQH